MISKILCNLFFFASTLSYASGTMTLDGRMAGKTEKTFSIESGPQIYVINKSALPEGLVKILEPMKYGDEVKIDVSIAGIAEVKSSKTKQ